MANNPDEKMPNIFISYRRDDNEGATLAHMLFRELRIRYADGTIFLDVDSRSPGLSFPKKVQAALDKTDALLVVIGPQWLEALNARLNETRDWVRYEVSEGLKRRDLPVVPVCHVRARLPTPEDLPESIRDLAFRDGTTLDPLQDFDSHVSRLLIDLERVIESNSGIEASSPLPANPGQSIDDSTGSKGEKTASLDSSIKVGQARSKKRPKRSKNIVPNQNSDQPLNDDQPSANVEANPASLPAKQLSIDNEFGETIVKPGTGERLSGSKVRLERVSVIYQFRDAEPVTAINDLSVSFEQGAFVAVSGPSGSGKTTLLKLIGGMEQPTTGTVFFDELNLRQQMPAQGFFAKLFSSPFKDEVTRLRQRIGFVPEQLDLVLDKTVAENVEITLLARDDIDKSERHAKVAYILSAVGLEKQMNETVSRLTKREHWRVGLARAVVGTPRLLLLDDPTAHLDQSATTALLNLLKKFNTLLGMTIVCCTRKELKVIDAANRLMKLENGSATAFGVRAENNTWNIARVRKLSDADD